MVARVIDEIDDENWLMMFVQELEVHVKQIIQMEKKIKQLIHQAREGRADGYKELIKVLLQSLNSRFVLLGYILKPIWDMKDHFSTLQIKIHIRLINGYSLKYYKSFQKEVVRCMK